jgi:ABC-type uncharacterized transport system auxiliary subunit
MLACSGCSLLGSHDPPKAGFDFGPPRAASSVRHTSNDARANIMVYEVAAPAWIDSSSIYYRLAYQQAARPMPYAQSEWVMPPAGLLTQRLRSSLSASGSSELRPVASEEPAVYALRSELFEFEQIFDQPGRSRGVLRLRATLEGQGMWAQRTFIIEKPAPTADAAGGVAALSQCADELAVLINEWAFGSSANVRDAAALEPGDGRLRAASRGRTRD